jgi:hypothetical protein
VCVKPVEISNGGVIFNNALIDFWEGIFIVPNAFLL